MRFVTAFFIFFATAALDARTIEVSSGGTFPNLRAAASVAQPGDSIVFRAGVYPGGDYVENLQGTAAAWITLIAAPNEQVTIRGGGNAWQFSDPAYLRIRGFNFEGQ